MLITTLSADAAFSITPVMGASTVATAPPAGFSLLPEALPAPTTNPSTAINTASGIASGRQRIAVAVGVIMGSPPHAGSKPRSVLRERLVPTHATPVAPATPVAHA
ncbi:MAG: hypothetical protein LC749_08220, partial [Actinobacteria bacterium]|nr:hypothetical protein [Actinomycetota bacterium]